MRVEFKYTCNASTCKSVAVLMSVVSKGWKAEQSTSTLSLLIKSSLGIADVICWQKSFSHTLAQQSRCNYFESSRHQYIKGGLVSNAYNTIEATCISLSRGDAQRRRMLPPGEWERDSHTRKARGARSSSLGGQYSTRLDRPNRCSTPEQRASNATRRASFWTEHFFLFRTVDSRHRCRLPLILLRECDRDWAKFVWTKVSFRLVGKEKLAYLATFLMQFFVGLTIRKYFVSLVYFEWLCNWLLFYLKLLNHKYSWPKLKSIFKETASFKYVNVNFVLKFDNVLIEKIISSKIL